MCPIFYSIMSRAHIRGIEQRVKNKKERFSEISILLSSNEENQSGIKRSSKWNILGLFLTLILQ